MDLKFRNSNDKQRIARSLQSFVRRSRFTFDLVDAGERLLRIYKVRLRTRRYYCGNHPNVCNVDNGRKHPKALFLEGADWVDFNDRLNDILDKAGIECKITSMWSRWIIRNWDVRRWVYPSVPPRNEFSNYEWDLRNDEDLFTKGSGKPEVSDFPYGTPGIHTRAKYYAATRTS